MSSSPRGNLRCIDVPVALVVLPAVVEHRPLESELAHLGQRGNDLLDREFAFVTPRTPHRRECGLGRLGRHDAFLLEERAVLRQRREVIAGVRDR